MVVFGSMQILIAFLSSCCKNMKNSFVKTTERKRFCIICSGMLILVMGMRSTMVGVDVPGYLNGFHMISDLGFIESFHTQIFNYEKGFIVFSKIVSMLGRNDHLFLFICAFFAIAPVAFMIYKRSPYPALSFVIFTSLPSFYWISSALRQTCAIAICAVALLAIQKRKKKEFIILVLAASCFHYAAIIFLICYPVYYIKISRRNRIGSFFLLIIIFFLRTYLYDLFKIFMRRQEYAADYNGSLNLLFVYCFIYSVCIFFGKNKEEQNGLMNIFFLACVTQTIANISQMAGRATLFFAISLILLIPQMISEYCTSSTRGILYYSSWICFSLFSVHLLSGLTQTGGGYWFWC